MGSSAARSDRTQDAPSDRGARRSNGNGYGPAAGNGHGQAEGYGRSDPAGRGSGQAGDYPNGPGRAANGRSRGRSGGGRHDQGNGNGQSNGYGADRGGSDSNGNGRRANGRAANGRGADGRAANGRGADGRAANGPGGDLGYGPGPGPGYDGGNGRSAGRGYGPGPGNGRSRVNGNGNGKGGNGYGGNGRPAATGYDAGPAGGYGRGAAGGPAGDGYGPDSGNRYDGRRSHGGRRRAGGRGPEAGSAGPGGPAGPGAPDGWDGQWHSGGPAGGPAAAGRATGTGWRRRNPDPAAGRERFDIKARLGAITGTGPLAGRGARGGAASPAAGAAGPAGGSGQAYLGRPDGPGADYDSFDDIVGYRGASTGTRARAAALRDRVDAARAAGTTYLPGRRPGAPGRGGSGGGPDGGPPPPRRKGSWWRHWTWKKALAVAGGLVASVILLIIVVVMVAYAKTQIPTDVSEVAASQSSTVYFANGKTQVGSFSTGTNRQLLTSSQIPTVLKNAVIAAEDRSFYTEGGVSPTGILRAAYQDISGGTFQGGSTITQQFVRQYYSTIGTEQTASRKLKEIFVAIKLSHSKSKDWILTNYLNTVYLGHDSYGVGAAAMSYFNRPAAKLSIAQSAMLAAMINQPGKFSPDPHAGAAYTALLARWHYVLTNMVRDNAITQQQANAQKFPKIVSGPSSMGWTGYRGYIMQAVENELIQNYGYTQQKIDTGGLKIVTTFNASMMNALYRAVNENEKQMRADGTPLPKFAHVGAVLEQPGTGAILAMYGGPSFNAKHCAALRCQYNMALQSRNQVGSSFKPYVLATAVKEGMNVQNSVLDGEEPICVPPDTLPMTMSTTTTNCPPDWFGVNIPGENTGPTTVTQAAAQSSDPAFEDLIHRAGTQNTIDLAKAFGVNAKSSGLQAKAGEVGIALGTASLTVEEQATTFAGLVDGGTYVTPHVVAKITTNSGARVQSRVVTRQVLTQQQAADVDFALSYDTIDGTAYPNGVLSPVRPTIGKTGTTDQAQSAFFIGAIPNYSLAVGMFTNQQNGRPGGQSLNVLASVNGQLGGYGGAWPTHIWSTFMQSAFGSLPVQQLPTPDYTGFTKWVQVKPKAKPKPENHNPGQGCRRHHHFFGLPCPGQGPGGGITPSPNPTPSPGPSCTPSAGAPCPQPTPSFPPGPGQQDHANATMALAQAAEEPAAISLRSG